MLVHATLYLDLKLKDKAMANVPVGEFDLFSTAMIPDEEKRTIYPTVDGKEINNIEKISGLENIKLNPGFVVTATYVETTSTIVDGEEVKDTTRTDISIFMDRLYKAYEDQVPKPQTQQES